jgi:hypothetical protein
MRVEEPWGFFPYTDGTAVFVCPSVGKRNAICWTIEDVTGSVKKYSDRGILLYRIDKWKLLIFRCYWPREGALVATLDDTVLV